MSVPYEKERPIKIDHIFIFPCRGIKGLEVDSVKVSSSGIKYDREFAIVDKEKLTLIA